MSAGAVFTATVRCPKGSTSNPLALSSSAISRYVTCCSGFSSTTIGSSNRWPSARRSRRSRSKCSKSTRSCATCWSMMNKPSALVATIKLSSTWPSGRRSKGNSETPALVPSDADGAIYGMASPSRGSPVPVESSGRLNVSGGGEGAARRKPPSPTTSPDAGA